MSLRSTLCLAFFLVACGDSNSGTGGDGGPDAPGPSFAGLWRLTSVTIASDAGTLVITDQNQHLTDPESGEMHDFRVNGTLELTADEIAYAQERVIDDAIPVVGAIEPNFVTRYTASGGDSGTFALTGLPTVAFSWTRPPAEKLEIDLDAANKLELQRLTHTPTNTMPVRGTITLGDGTPEFASPHVSIAFLHRGSGFEIDPRDDQTITFSGNTATFELDRDRGALGTQRIVFGDPDTAIAVGLVIVWDDADGNGEPSETLFDQCVTPAPADAGPGDDCLRGVSPIFVVARSGDSAELSASPYAYLREGWTQGLFIQDLRDGSASNGIVSLDPTVGVPFDVFVPPSPQQTFVPVFQF